MFVLRVYRVILVYSNTWIKPPSNININVIIIIMFPTPLPTDVVNIFLLICATWFNLCEKLLFIFCLTFNQSKFEKKNCKDFTLLSITIGTYTMYPVSYGKESQNKKKEDVSGFTSWPFRIFCDILCIHICTLKSMFTIKTHTA